MPHRSLPQLSSRLCAGAKPPPQSRPALAEGTLQAILDALGPPLLLVDEAATPIFVNRRAARILARGDGLAIGPAGLTTRSRKATRELRAAIAGAAANAHSSRARPLTLHVTVARQLRRRPGRRHGRLCSPLHHRVRRAYPDRPGECRRLFSVDSP